MEEVAGLNARLGRGVQDYHLPAETRVQVTYYRAGLDLFFRGSFHGQVVGTCARCLEDYIFDLDRPFTFVLTPAVAAGDRPGAQSAEEMFLSTYQGDEIDLTPLVHEQMILALPTRPLCGEGCRGLCPRCGANLNSGPCGCPVPGGDARLAVLSQLARGK